ncbi:MAG: cryptochrome/photolyase family protein [Sphingobacteriales bacterium]|nr:MAG: cryptochrome/photolyase family protein [Sphingobacteriales bacterium]TAF80000.1 MAG: cryptochrome/photolyase family protein [Sphingobacteriales bacterium]
MQNTLKLILGDQLNSQHSWYKTPNTNTTFLMMEIMPEQEYVKHHIQKIIGFFSAMRCFARTLKANGHKVIYLTLDDTDNLQSFEANIIQAIKTYNIQNFAYQLPDEYRLDVLLKSIGESLNLAVEVFDTEHFYTQRNDVKEFFADKKQFLMESFYRDMRKKHHILMDDANKPMGGKWNFDHENRKKYDGKIPLKPHLKFERDETEILNIIRAMQVKYFGNVDIKHFELPQSRKHMLTLLAYFCDQLLPAFGTYEDALLKNHLTLFHSKLSFGLNLKLISPQEVVQTVIAKYVQNPYLITIAQVEGFIRQVIGWREYMRGIYWAKMPEFAQLNFFENNRKLPHWFWTGEVKMSCMQHCINNSLDKSYAHHIQRLMVIGNFALLAGCNPSEVDAWYLGVYADATEWVQITNTRGMSQYADGGIVGSKPYVSSANYIDKMSDYCKTCVYDKTKKYGENACPFNSLYWNFYHKHQNKLKNNQRIGMMLNLIDKMDKDELGKILNKAEAHLQNIENL